MVGVFHSGLRKPGLLHAPEKLRPGDERWDVTVTLNAGAAAGLIGRRAWPVPSLEAPIVTDIAYSAALPASITVPVTMVSVFVFIIVLATRLNRFAAPSARPLTRDVQYLCPRKCQS